jgi:signal transduction histidine kinase/CheY-like chemotaxis protein
MDHSEILSLMIALTRPDGRVEAAARLARYVGAEEMIIFIRDDEVEKLLPAPGFRQTLPAATAWRRFLERCRPQTVASGEVAYPTAEIRRKVLAVTGSDGTVAALLGGDPKPEAALAVAPALPLLATALGSERHMRLYEAQAALARQAAEQSRLLAASLDRARLALRKALLEAEAANRAKDEFLAALSHELRTPLNPALITAGSMENDPSLDPETRVNAGIIRRSVELEARLIDDLLDLTRITHGKLGLVKSWVDVHAVLESTKEVFAGEGNIHAPIEWDLSAREHHVEGDAVRLQQVFWNIVKNALKFTAKSGSIKVVTRNEEAGKIAVRVTDTGIGIKPELLPRIFEAFEQDKSNPHRFGGLGLGLAIARALVELHGGTIRAESEGPGRGATFTVTLDTVEAHISAPPAVATPNEPECSLRLLLVEDHDSTREVLARVLGRDGHSVSVASTGREALAVLEEDQRFDVVLADIGLPDQSGFDLMRIVSERYRIPGVALSGYGMEEDLAHSRAAGFLAHLVKPVQFAQVRATLRQIARSRA